MLATGVAVVTWSSPWLVETTASEPATALRPSATIIGGGAAKGVSAVVAEAEPWTGGLGRSRLTRSGPLSDSTPE